MDTLLASVSTSISELKKNPSAIIDQAQGAPVAILNHNRPTAYLVPAASYELMLERLDDLQLAVTIAARSSEKPEAIEVNINDL